MSRIMEFIQLIADPNRDTIEKQNTVNYLLASTHELDETTRTITDKTNMPQTKPTSRD